MPEGEGATLSFGSVFPLTHGVVGRGGWLLGLIYSGLLRFTPVYSGLVQSVSGTMGTKSEFQGPKDDALGTRLRRRDSDGAEQRHGLQGGAVYGLVCLD